MRSLLKVGMSLLLLALVLIGLSYSMLRAQGTAPRVDRESRTVVSETRKLATGPNAAITAVRLSGPIDLTLRQGAVPSLVIKGEQRLMGNIYTGQEKGVLDIGPKGMLWDPLESTCRHASLSIL